MRRIAASVIFFILLFSATTVSATAYRAVDLGLQASWGTTYCSATAINNRGQIVGNFGGVAYIWDAEGKRVLDSNSHAYAINDAGQVAGSVSTYAGMRACKWTDNTCTVLDINGVALRSSNAFGINSNGSVVGSAWIPNGDESLIKAYLWDEQGAHELPGFTAYNAEARAINDSNRIAGWSNVPTSLNACEWSDSQPKDLKSLYLSSQAYAINNSGVIAGFTSFPDTQGRACVWSGNSIYNLAAFQGANTSCAWGINESGLVVGYCDKGDSKLQACFWDDNGIHQLENLPGYISSQALGVNDSGYIVGFCTTADGMTNAVLWQPVPEPSSILVLLAGLAGTRGIAFRRRK